MLKKFFSQLKVLNEISRSKCFSHSFCFFIFRYRKICIPLGKQISRQKAKILIVICIAISLVLSWPAPVLYGHSTVNTTNPNITGTRCYTDDKFKNTKYQSYFNAVLIILVFGFLSLLVIIYCRIGRVVSKHNTFKSSVLKATISDTSKGNITVSTDLSAEHKASKTFEEENRIDKMKCPNSKVTTVTGADSGMSANLEKKRNKKKQYEKLKFNRAKRTTLMFFLITSFFFISNTSHLILKILAFVKTEFVSDMSFTGKVLYNTFVWCFFINNVANCFIYGFCDVQFRKEVKNLYNRFFL